MQSDATLATIQKQLRRLITAPEGAQAAPAGDGGAAAAFLRGDRGVVPATRLAVYAHAWFTRLHDALREDHPALAEALGADAFHDLVRTYLMARPPSRPSLRDAGARLAEHLETPPFAAIFARRCPYAADLARFEWALVESFDAADAPTLAPAALAAVPPGLWASLRFTLTPSLRRLECSWPVHELRARRDRVPDETWCAAPALAPRPTALCVWRRDERVRYEPLAPLEAQALAALAAGVDYGALCEGVSEAVGEADAPARAAALLAGWLERGWIAALDYA